MSSTLIYLALAQVACALSIKQPGNSANNIQARSGHFQKREIATGVKVALGICIPIASFTIILGVIIFMMYPAHLRKLRRDNPGARIGLTELMNGKITRQPAPPKYSANDDSTLNVPLETMDPPSYQAEPRSQPHTAPVTQAEARHAALMS